jgi:hypothetical protein
VHVTPTELDPLLSRSRWSPNQTGCAVCMTGSQKDTVGTGPKFVNDFSRARACACAQGEGRSGYPAGADGHILVVAVISSQKFRSALRGVPVDCQ